MCWDSRTGQMGQAEQKKVQTKKCNISPQPGGEGGEGRLARAVYVRPLTPRELHHKSSKDGATLPGVSQGQVPTAPGPKAPPGGDVRRRIARSACILCHVTGGRSGRRLNSAGESTCLHQPRVEKCFAWVGPPAESAASLGSPTHPPQKTGPAAGPRNSPRRPTGRC